MGCASGNLDEELVQMGDFSQIIGIDYDESALTSAKKRLPNARYFNANLNHGNVIGEVSEIVGVEKFMSIIALDVLEHMQNPTKRQEVLEQLVDHLEDNGVIIIGMPETADQNDPWYLKMFKNVWNRFDKDPTHHCKPTTSEFTQDVNSAGLEIVEDLRYFPIPLPGKMIRLPFSANRMVVARKVQQSKQR